jgi:hypothetical protein
VSYGRTFVTQRPTRLGVVPWVTATALVARVQPRRHAGLGRRVPIVGRVTMDLTMIDLTDVAADVGDEVVLFGEQGDAPLDRRGRALERDARLRGDVHHRQARDAHLRARRAAGQADDAGGRARRVGDQAADHFRMRGRPPGGGLAAARRS